MSKLKAYFLNKKYHDFLKSNIPEFLFKDRPYIGFIGINIQNQKYAIPLWSDKSNTYRTNHKYSFFIPDENNKKLGILRIDKMIPVLENKAFINEISINELLYEDSIRLIKELKYINQPKIVEQINILANEARYSKNNEDLKFAIDFELAEKYCFDWAWQHDILTETKIDNLSLSNSKTKIKNRYQSYLQEDHFDKMYDQLIKKGEWSLIIDEFYTFGIEIKEEDEAKILNICRDKEKLFSWIHKNQQTIVEEATNIYFEKQKDCSENDYQCSNDYFSAHELGIEFILPIESKSDFENFLETDYLIREFMFQHVWSEVINIASDETLLEKTINEINSNKQKVGI